MFEDLELLKMPAALPRAASAGHRVERQRALALDVLLRARVTNECTAGVDGYAIHELYIYIRSIPAAGPKRAWRAADQSKRLKSLSIMTP